MLLSFIEQKSDEIIKCAVYKGASDIHIFPAPKLSDIYLKIDDRLILYEKIKNNDAERLISHFKFRSKMDIGERRRPQNGSLHVQINSHYFDLRLSTLPTSPHESLAIRILPQDEIISLSKLTLFPKQVVQLQSLIKKAHGLLLVSGPTGSGKTTTIYSLLSDKSLRERRIVTIEDPIEKRINGFLQVEVNEKAGLTYSEILKATLRHDPDIIVIGEIRDEKTAKIAIRAAMTGHLVISTIHANNSEGILKRLREFGISKIDIKETVVGLISQRLLKLKCPICTHYCSIHCSYNSTHRRLAIFEIVAGEALEKIFENNRKNVQYETLSKLIAKSISLGYVFEAEFERWQC